MNPQLSNPLLQTGGLPLFDQIKPEHVNQAMEELLISTSKALELVTASDFPSDWHAIAKVLDVCTEQLSMSWGAVSHLNHVADSPELRAAYNDALPKVTEFWTRLGADERLYAKYKAVNSEQLDAPQKQALKNALRNFVLGGADLQGEAKTRYAAIQERMAELSQKFSENALDATDRFSLFVSEADLAGVPDDVIHTARAAAEKDGKEGYKLSLKMPCYLPVMQFATSSDLRQKLYRAYVTRASDQTDAIAINVSQSIEQRQHVECIIHIACPPLLCVAFRAPYTTIVRCYCNVSPRSIHANQRHRCFWSERTTRAATTAIEYNGGKRCWSGRWEGKEAMNPSAMTRILNGIERDGFKSCEVVAFQRTTCHGERARRNGELFGREERTINHGCYRFDRSRYFFARRLCRLLSSSSRPSMNAWITLFDLLSIASPVLTNNVALFPTSSEPYVAATPKSCAGHSVSPRSASSSDIPNARAVPA
jgi:hypothetical protein